MFSFINSHPHLIKPHIHTPHLFRFSHIKKLPSDAKKLLLSTFLFSLADPVLVVFINAFLWRVAGDFKFNAVYNLGLFLALSAGYYINGRLLRRFNIKFLYTVGLISSALVSVVIVFLIQANYLVLFGAGIITGLSWAFYWANKTDMLLSVTDEENRIYYTSLESSLITVSAALVPLLAGWFIIFGESNNLYDAQVGYYTLVLLALFLLIVAGLVVMRASFGEIDVKSLKLKKVQKEWNLFRSMRLILGLIDGVNLFLPALLVLRYLGEEGILGSLLSIAAVVSALTMNLSGRFLGVKQRPFLMVTAMILLTFSSLFFVVTYSDFSVLVYQVCISIYRPFVWLAMNSIVIDLIKQESRITNDSYYTYIFDSELFLNYGRFASVAIFITMFLLLDERAALSISVLSSVFILIFVYIVFSKLRKVDKYI